MSRSIQERVVKCEEEINSIKTSQTTQADSYKFYSYRTENLFNSYDENNGTLIEVIFHPSKADSSQVICNFLETQMFQQIYSMFSVDPSNPLRAVWFLDKREIYPQIYDWQKYFYITCTSNCEGFLQTIIY